MSEPLKTDEKGIKEQISNINEKLDILLPKEKGKEKPFKLKWSLRMRQRSVAKQNNLLVFHLCRNKLSKATIEKLSDGKIMVNGVPRPVEIDQVFLWEGRTPAIFMPEWDLYPIGTMDYYESLVEKDRNANGIKTLIAMLESKEYEIKKVNGGKMIYIIGGIIAVIIVIYLFFGGNLS